MSDAGPRGPHVDDKEDLYRFITTSVWWVAEANRPSSAAFDERVFSVNIASLTTQEESLRQLWDDLQCPRGGIVSFLCGYGRSLGFDARRELDPHFPQNLAHAHVYYDGGSASRKKKARRLAQDCEVVVEPQF